MQPFGHAWVMLTLTGARIKTLLEQPGASDRITLRP